MFRNFIIEKTHTQNKDKFFGNSHDGEKMVKHNHHKQHDIFRNNTKHRIKQSPSQNTLQNQNNTTTKYRIKQSPSQTPRQTTHCITTL
jgi:hypothetical protein